MDSTEQNLIEKKNLLILLIAAVLLVGCGETLKSSWGNFRAYYNTYYNAQDNFYTGLKKFQNQPFTIDPTQPVRIHHAPVQAGNSDFQKAIDKGAKILRKFPETKWVDDAILLIGKSYYYRQEFFSALQKFEELRNIATEPEMEQLAIIWKGRTQLDLDLNAEGVTFLESELENYPLEWSSARKGVIQALAGEHHAMLENWEESTDKLYNAVSNIEDKALLGRAYFLYGQMLERVERYGEAYFAFSRVPKNFPGFEYNYWARFKQADIARKEGNMDLAISIFEELSRDDKNMDRRGKLAFEIAHTLEMKGEVSEAEKRYKNLLYGQEGQNFQIQDLRADIYYRLGKIYSDEYDNLSVAAAYFDSSSTSSHTLTNIETDQNPEELSEAFGEYKQLQNTVNRADSLLWLGSLSPVQLDSALAEIKAQKRRALLQKQESETESGEMIANANITNADNQNSTSASRYGFLNYQNTRLVNQSKAEFRAIWGNRPLVDNWRRMRVLRRPNNSSSDLTSGDNSESDIEENEVVAMNVEDIPRTQEAKEELRVEKSNAQYNIGNLLFLNLNSPDEAKEYFHKVINNQADKELRPRAMYSLYEVFKTEDNQDSLQYWRDKILQEYPDTKYAQRIQNSSDTSPKSVESDSTQKLIQQFQQVINTSGNNKASELRELALANRSSKLAPYIHYQAIEAYIEQAKMYDKFADSLESSNLKILSDTSSSTVDFNQFNGEQFSFSNMYWDSARSVSKEFDTTFTTAKQRKKVEKLLERLEQETSTPLPTCEETGISLSVEPSMDEFLSTIVYPEKVKDMSVSGQVIYSFVVTGTGEVKSFELVSQSTSLGIEEAFERAFEQSLRFEPLKVENPPPAIKCEVSFPIKL